MATGDKKCSVCGSIKSADNYTAKQSRCNACRSANNRTKANLSTDNFLFLKFTKLKDRHRAKKFEGDVLTFEDLQLLY